MIKTFVAIGLGAVIALRHWPPWRNPRPAGGDGSHSRIPAHSRNAHKERARARG